MARVEGKETLALPRAEVWRRLNDPDVLGRSIPGCSGFERIDDGRFKTSITVAIGPVRGTYDGTVEYRDVEEPERCTIAVSGRGDKGTIDGEGAITLAERGDATEVGYEGTFKLTGPVAGVGQRLAPGVSRKMIVETLKNLGAAAPEATAPEAAAPQATAPEPTAAPAARATATDTPPPAPPANDFRPVSLPSWAIFALGLVAGVVLTILVEAIL
jgi:uncharacterized protein